MSESKLLTEDVFLESLSLKESKDSKKRSNVLHVLEGACMEMDTVNRNNRIYPKEQKMSSYDTYFNIIF